MRHQPISVVAAGFGVSVRTARKWQVRYRQGGVSALYDASSRPVRCQSRFCEQDTERIRYQWDNPGQMLHIDIKKLGKIDGVGHRFLGRQQAKQRRAGWEYLHVCVDGVCRIAFTAVMPDERKESATAFLRQAVAYYQSLGIKVERVLTDYGTGYQSFVWRDTCTELGIKHRRTRPYRPQTNGKAERFIRSAMNEWAYAKAYAHSHDRTAALALWINWYNTIRSHSALGRIPPAQWLAQNGYNVLRLNTELCATMCCKTISCSTSPYFNMPFHYYAVDTWLMFCSMM